MFNGKELIYLEKDIFFEKVKEKARELSPKQVELAKYLMKNYKAAAFQNIV